MIATYGLQVLRARGAPPLNRLFVLALHASQNRVDVRRSLVVLQGVRDAFAAVLPQQYFEATYDDPVEALAMYTLCKSRSEFRSRQPQEPVGEG